MTTLRASSTWFGFQDPPECSYEKVARGGLITNRCSGNEPAFSFVSFLLGKIEEGIRENGGNQTWGTKAIRDQSFVIF